MTMETSSLIIPRVEVHWGPVNLTSPQKTPQFYTEVSQLDALGPLVYDVRVSLEDQGQTPSGSMKWNPSGLGFQLYEKFLQSYIEFSIVINFYYVKGGNISFEFYWGGQSDDYGKEMSLSLKLVTFMDGLINSNMYSTVQADAEEKGMSHKDSLINLGNQFGVDANSLIKYTSVALSDTSKSIVKMNYTDGSNFMDSMQNLAKNNGNMVFFNNIGKPSAVVYTPYLWSVSKGSIPVDASERLKESTPKSPDPTVRYMYAISPGVIQSVSRTYEWQPPQKSQELSSMLGRKPQPLPSSTNPKTKTIPDSQTNKSAKRAKAPQGVHSSPNTPNVRSYNNEDGPRKLDFFTQERTAKLSMSTLMCPALTGIKPLDIILIRSYSNNFVEDWIVNSVEYQQTQGGVDISIQASRTFGVGKPMAEGPINNFFAGKKLSTVEDWEAYAWQLSGRKAQKTQLQGSQLPALPEETVTKPVLSTPTPIAENSTLYSNNSETNVVTIQDPGFYRYLKNLLKANDFTFRDSKDGSSGLVIGMDNNMLEALSRRYQTEELSGGPFNASVQGSTSRTFSSAAETFESITPYSAKALSPEFYRFVKEAYKLDPLSNKIFNDSKMIINLSAEEINRVYQEYVIRTSR